MKENIVSQAGPPVVPASSTAKNASQAGTPVPPDVSQAGTPGVPAMKYFLGLDVGSVNSRIAIIDEARRIVHLGCERITASPRKSIQRLLAALPAHPADIASAGVSGCGAATIPEEYGWTSYTSPLAIASGVLHFHPDARTIIQIGGQTSLVISLEDGLKKPWKVNSNPLCAAGTGRFIEQQAYRLGISIEDFARLALEYQASPPRIAARCSVFAKSDLIHLQQNGVPLAAMLRGLSDSIARMIISLQRGNLEEPMYLVGGVAANGSVKKALEEVISTSFQHDIAIDVPEFYDYVEAIGSALLSAASGKQATIGPLMDGGPGDGEPGRPQQQYLTLPPLTPVTAGPDRKPPKIEDAFVGYLGVDVGSTSTKAVIMDETGKNVVAKSYLMTAGRPLDAIKEVFKNLQQMVEGGCTIAGVGVTGSGRYLVGSFIGADLIKNEITAQTRAAAEVDSEADIIEIGGQDSKLVIKRNGIVIDYQMNKACAAGTGSFIDELADLMGISVKNGEFARLAFQAPHTMDLGTRCAAFMSQAVATARQDGVPVEVIAASLANAICRNYLSKVVGPRRLGNKVILTGAVFYNTAVVSAFKDALAGKTITVPEHKEITGAIGAALLAREQVGLSPAAGRSGEVATPGGNGCGDRAATNSHFKGFDAVVNANYTLSTFTCNKCDHNCTISRMQLPKEKPTFYGSRCDLFDANAGQEKIATAFDEREKLLFREYRENSGKGPTVGIPRSLLIYDYAPLFLGFLNALGVRVILSNKTSPVTIERSVELSYTDSCFPVKLLHGHANALKDADFILFPSAIRLGLKEGDENQKYACPLVQASPYIVRETLGLKDKLLTPIIDFSLGNDEVMANLSAVAGRLGFSEKEGMRAALAGLEAQREFEKALLEKGSALLQQLKRSEQLGVVLLARSYVSQDAGANMAIAEKLAQLGVTPIPLDFLPLASIDVKKYSDRPYWMAEARHIAGAAIVAGDPDLYGLALTNFGCGPNSFILNIVEDILGDKPCGQLEVDEHAAEAGIVTRLEAFVDTIRSFHLSARRGQAPPPPEAIYRGSPAYANPQKVLLIPRMSPHTEAFCAAAQAFGANAVSLPEPDDRNLLYSNSVTSGKECLPYRVTLGDFIRYFKDNGHREVMDGNVEGLMAGSYGPCRLGKYALEQFRVLKDMGLDMPVRSTVSNNGYRDLNLGPDFERLAWKGVVAIDMLLKLLRRTRPYEKTTGAADQLFDRYLGMITGRTRRKQGFKDVLNQAIEEFQSIVDPGQPRKPLVGINGEIFLRSNRFSNKDLERVCEKMGLEVVVSPWTEWVEYIYHRNIEDAVKDRKLKKFIIASIKRWVLLKDEHRIARIFSPVIDTRELSTRELLHLSGDYLSSRCGSEAVLSIGTGIEWMKNPAFAGVISVMPHGCMPGGIVAAMAAKFSDQYHKPWITLSYDGFPETSNLAKINSFAEIIKFRRNGATP
ncbi:MAG: hypothetical protein HYY29_02495 [Chloroflexi bacterium]|nr:hypothetical protein [Chloroflexota bacterium]